MISIISAAKFTYANGAKAHLVYLLENTPNPPYIVPAKGWKIIGYTSSAPYSSDGDTFAIMLEKQTPEDETNLTKGSNYPEGTQIWHHFNQDLFKEYYLNPQLLQK